MQSSEAGKVKVSVKDFVIVRLETRNYANEYTSNCIFIQEATTPDSPLPTGGVFFVIKYQLQVKYPIKI